MNSNKKALAYIFIVIAFFGAVYFLNLEKTVTAASSDNLSNYAWSETIGWISFNSTNQSTATNYGVNVSASGAISGYAWSENVGWINFAGANLDKITGKVTGTISAIAGAGRIDGWDGIIKLSGTAVNGSPYGVSVTGCNWGGYAWGSDVVGWIHFTGSTYGVIGTGNACVTVSASYIVTASINSGTGTITGPGINCPGDCSEIYPSGTWVTLIATPALGYAFNNWIPSVGTICGGQGNTCSALIDADKTARANFNPVAASFDYTLTNSGASEVTKTSGNAFTTNTITKTLIPPGVPEPVTLSVSSLPSGVSVDSISAQGCEPDCTSTITLKVEPTASVGTYPITVTGSPLSKQTGFNLVISGNPMTVSCSAFPTTAFLGKTITWTANVSGGTSPFTYVWSGSSPISTTPVGPIAAATHSQQISYSTIGQKTATVMVTDSSLPTPIQASCPPTAFVRINFDPDLEEF